MTAGELTDLLTRVYGSLSRKDLDAWLDLATPDVELHDVAEMPGSGVHRGRREARAWAEEMLRLVEEWRWTPQEVLLQAGDTAVLRVSVTGCSKAGIPIDMTVFHVVRAEDGKLASVQGFFDRASAMEVAGR